MGHENKVLVAAGLSMFVLTACAKQVEPTIPVLPTPILLPTSAVIPTVEETRTLIISPDSRFAQFDLKNQRIVREANPGENVLLQYPKITHVGRIQIPRIGFFYVAAIGSSDGDEKIIYSLIENPDCIYNELRKNNRLGEPKLGVWTPADVRLDQFRGTVIAAYSISNPSPWLETQSVVYEGNTIACPKNSQLEERARAIGTSVQRLAELVGRFAQELFERIK